MGEERSAHDVTGLLLAWRGGDQRAIEGLVPLLERELHHIAKRYMAARSDGHFDTLLVGTEVGVLVDKTSETMAAV